MTSSGRGMSLGALVNRVIIAALIVVGLSSTTAAQLAAPRPEHARLDTFAGRWTIDGESEGGKVLLSETCEWFPGRFHLVCRREGKGPRGTVAGHSIMTWEASANTYAMITINSNGASLIAHGTLADNVWTWNGTVDVAGRALKVRLTTTSQSPSAYTSVASTATIFGSRARSLRRCAVQIRLHSKASTERVRDLQCGSRACSRREACAPTCRGTEATRGR